MVEPFLKSLKVLAFMEEAFISSEKVAVTLAVEATPVAALAVGEVLVTVGGVVSSVGPVVLPKNAMSSTGPGPDSFSPPRSTQGSR